LDVSSIIPMRMSQSYRDSGSLSRRCALLCQVYIKQAGCGESCSFHPDGRISLEGAALVTLVLRNKEYEVRPGMTLLSALQKINVVPESVIATREGEMILDDEILKNGDVIKLIAVISGG
jgi:sulfur carrier protein ThiS